MKRAGSCTVTPLIRRVLALIGRLVSLRRGGERLRAEGVAFADLTQAFAEPPDHTYRDACCHLNDIGNRILAKNIASILSRNATSR